MTKFILLTTIHILSVIYVLFMKKSNLIILLETYAGDHYFVKH